MAKATDGANGANENDNLHVVHRCVRKDDELLCDVQDASEELAPINAEVFAIEYRECCENTRHAQRLRGMMMGFWAIFSGILFVAVAASLTTIDKLPNQAWVFVMLISISGVAVTYFFQEVEIRERGYYREWCKRCRVLEARMGLAGQYWRTYEKLVAPEERVMRLSTMVRVYQFGVLLWMAMFILSLLALVLP